jgi:phosphatidylglycerophosphatase A
VTVRAEPPLPYRVIATGFFTGYIPWGSGTFASALALLIWLIPGIRNPVVLGLLIVSALLWGRVAANSVAGAVGNQLSSTGALTKSIFGRRHAEADPSIVVIDEMVGMWITLLFLPATPVAIAAAFVFFRFFDIVKPFPVARLERIGDGWGIMLDDVMSGVYANIACRLLFLFF